MVTYLVNKVTYGLVDLSSKTVVQLDSKSLNAMHMHVVWGGESMKVYLFEQNVLMSWGSWTD